MFSSHSLTAHTLLPSKENSKTVQGRLIGSFIFILDLEFRHRHEWSNQEHTNTITLSTLQQTSVLHHPCDQGFFFLCVTCLDPFTKTGRLREMRTHVLRLHTHHETFDNDMKMTRYYHTCSRLWFAKMILAELMRLIHRRYCQNMNVAHVVYIHLVFKKIYIFRADDIIWYYK